MSEIEARQQLAQAERDLEAAKRRVLDAQVALAAAAINTIGQRAA